jgi:hypothetical protein
MRRRQFAALAGTGISLPLTGCLSFLQEVTSPRPNGTAKAAVTKSTFTEESAGDTPVYSLRGQITNTGEVRLRSPSVTITFYSTDGAVLASRSARIYSLTPGQRWNLVAIYTERGPTPPVKGTIELDELQPVGTYAHPPDLTVSEVTLTSGPAPAISGKITNTSDEPISVSAECQFLTAQKHVIGIGSDSLWPLDAGETWLFFVDWSAFSTVDRPWGRTPSAPTANRHKDVRQEVSAERATQVTGYELFLAATGRGYD